MPKWIRAILEANGLAKDATEEMAARKYADLLKEGFEFVEPAGERSAVSDTAGGGGAAGAQDIEGRAAVTPDKGQGTQAVESGGAEDVAGKERERLSGIRSAFKAARMDPDSPEATALYENQQAGVADARAIILDALIKRSVPKTRVSVGDTDAQKYRSAVGASLRMRLRHTVGDPTKVPGASDFRGRTLHELARMSLERAGVNLSGLSRVEIAQRALAPHTTSDFPYVMLDVMHASLQEIVSQYTPTYQAIVASSTATDFRDKYSVRLEGGTTLLPVGEDGEYPGTSITDSGNKYRVQRKGRRIAFTFEAIINDQLGALDAVPRKFAAAALRMENSMVFGLLTSNPTLDDGFALFSAQHNNLMTTELGPVDSAALDAAKVMLALQEGGEGEPLNITPQTLLTPQVQNSNARKLLESSGSLEAGENAMVINPYRGMASVVSEALLDVYNGNAWWLFASPALYPVLETATLEGYESVFVDSEPVFKSDGIEMKVRHIFGVGAVGYEGAVFNPGQ